MIDRQLKQWIDETPHGASLRFIVGMRDSGKTEMLTHLLSLLLARGVPEANTLYVDAFDSSIRPFGMGSQIVSYILAALPAEGDVYVFIREAPILPDAEKVFAALMERKRFHIFASASSRSLFRQCEEMFRLKPADSIEVMPPQGRRFTRDSARALADAIFMRDVLWPNKIANVRILPLIGAWLSDNLGDSTSLRIIAAAISPEGKLLSPHTVDAYLMALQDAHLIERSPGFDTLLGEPVARGARYFFVDPWLRLAFFGPAPSDEKRRMALNVAYLNLRAQAKAVYSCLDDERVDFVTRVGRGYEYWKVGKDGVLKQVPDPGRTSPGAAPRTPPGARRPAAAPGSGEARSMSSPKP